MTRSTVFMDIDGQAVRLPEAVAFPEDVREVEIRAIGSSRLITPVGKRWDDFFLHGPRVSEDFMVDRERDQVKLEEREPFYCVFQFE
jgi:antitoxin VapB